MSCYICNSEWLVIPDNLYSQHLDIDEIAIKKMSVCYTEICMLTLMNEIRLKISNLGILICPQDLLTLVDTDMNNVFPSPEFVCGTCNLSNNQDRLWTATHGWTSKCLSCLPNCNGDIKCPFKKVITSLEEYPFCGGHVCLYKEFQKKNNQLKPFKQIESL